MDSDNKKIMELNDKVDKLLNEINSIRDILSMRYSNKKIKLSSNLSLYSFNNPDIFKESSSIKDTSNNNATIFKE